MNQVCVHCAALPGENNFKCCADGKVRLPNLLVFAEGLPDLLCSNSAQTKRFRNNIRLYNNAFSFASLQANIQPPPGNGPPCFRICRQTFHRYGALYPGQDFQPNFSQLYVIEARPQLNLRTNNPMFNELDRRTMEIIDMVINCGSPYAAAYRNMARVETAQHEHKPVSVVTTVMREGIDRRWDA